MLLLGVDHTANTTIHLGEYETRPLPYRKKYVTLLKEGRLSGSITLRLITAARTSALSMAGWKAKGCSAASRWAARRTGPIERCDPGGHGKFNRTRPSFSIPSAWMKNVMMRG